MLILEINNITIITVKVINYLCVIYVAGKYESINLWRNFVIEVKVDELKTKTIIIDKKSYKTLVIFFVRYILKVSDTVLNEVLDKAKKIIGTKEFHNTKILINTDDK